MRSSRPAQDRGIEDLTDDDLLLDAVDAVVLEALAALLLVYSKDAPEVHGRMADEFEWLEAERAIESSAVALDLPNCAASRRHRRTPP